MRATICGTGAAFPKYVRSNDEIAGMVDTNDEWIVSRTGISSRHIAKEETTVSLAIEAATKAISNASIDPLDIDIVIVATGSPENIFPCTACEVIAAVGADNAVGHDISAACSGFVMAYNMVSAYMEAGIYKNALIIGAECLSNLTDWTDRGTCILFGDGAGAAVVTACEGAMYIPVAHSDGKKGVALTCKSGNVKGYEERDYYISMDGQAIFKFAVSKVPEVINEVLSKNNLSVEDIDWIVLHQANKRIIEAVARQLKVSVDKFPMNLSKTGNTSSASIPLLLDEMNCEGLIKKGQKLIIAGFGAGLIWGANIIEW